MTPPTSEATYERARRLANIAMWTIVLQCRRVKSAEPEDDDFIFRKWADFEFLIYALMRLRRTAILASKIKKIETHIKKAIDEFDKTLPDLKKMRDTLEHIDDYAIDEGRNKKISRKSLEVGSINDTEFEWLGCKLNAEVALRASEVLFERIKNNSPLKQV